jgi:hypothetical protein
MNTWKYENLFYLTSKKKRILKIIDHYEIYKKILKIKGDVLEFGVFKGASLIRFLTFRDLVENPKKRKIYGFDIFGKFPSPKKKSKNFKADKIFSKRHDQNIGLGIKQQILEKYLTKKKFNNFKLIKGNVIETLPSFIKKNKNIKISLLHIDLDTYEPTKFVLECLFSKLSKNAIILLDDYNHIKGATLATNEFLKKTNLKIKKVSKNGRPYFIEKI